MSQSITTQAVEVSEIAPGLMAQLNEALFASDATVRDEIVALNHELREARIARDQELEARARLNLRFSALLDAMPGAVLVLDDQHNIILTNPSAEAFLGEGLLNRNFLEVVDERAIRISENGSELTLHSGLRLALSNRISDQFGDQIVLLTDITDRVENEQRQRLETLGRVMGGLAHQIRTPLNAALLHLDGASRKQGRAHEGKLSKTKDCLRHVERIVNNSLVYLREQKQEEEECSVKALLAALQSSLATATNAAKWSVVMDCEDVVIKADKESFLSALIAITENAFEITPDTPIEITLTHSPSGITLNILDAGPGIDEATLPHVFEPFFSTRRNGCGLGLPLAHRIITNHDGRLIARNGAAGGAEFVIEVPSSRVLRVIPRTKSAE